MSMCYMFDIQAVKGFIDESAFCASKLTTLCENKASSVVFFSNVRATTVPFMVHSYANA